MEGSGPRTKLAVSVVRRRELLVGCGLIALGFAMPVFFTVQNFRILELLQQALHHEDRLDLVMAAMRLVLLNSIRAVPHYLGIFMVAESLEFRWNDRNLWALNALLVVVVLRITYWGIDALHNVHYDFGLPALAVMGLVILFDKMDYKYIAMDKKAMLIVTSLTAFQFLDVMPAAHGLPVGRGETSSYVKMTGAVLDVSDELNALTAICCVVFLCISGLFFFLLRDENRLREMTALREQNEAIRTEAQLKEMQNRTYREMQHLVHDLKSPLTVVQTLAGVIKMECEAQQREEALPLLERIEGAVDQMSQMISEILYEEKTSVTTVEKILNRVCAQLSIEEYAPFVQLEVADAQAEVRVNSVLFPRALVNLVQNSAHAIPEGRSPRIIIRSDSSNGWVRFQVEDNGHGIPPERQEAIWERGYSSTASSGLGLSFVRNVVERMDGKIGLISVPGEGTTITLWIPKEGEEHGSDPERDYFMY